MGIRSFLHRITAPPLSGERIDEPCKMVCIVNQSLKMGKGKIAAQVGHGAVMATMKAGMEKPINLEQWFTTGQKKVCLKGRDAEHLLELEQQAKAAGVLTTLVHDAGHTQIPSGSLTVLALGPEIEATLEEITGELKLL
ncbi:MAG: peptidyl-tRNA hydrolase Pth2 [Candidatus Poseidoniaceae archaeon]|nr:peptidyl-tRNA hydrolase Pth2 [Candidatus Poseidoniaceae archaeon]